jgi:hypothetical protein
MASMYDAIQDRTLTERGDIIDKLVLYASSLATRAARPDSERGLAVTTPQRMLLKRALVRASGDDAGDLRMLFWVVRDLWSGVVRH